MRAAPIPITRPGAKSAAPAAHAAPTSAPLCLPSLPFAATVGEAVRLSGLSRTALYALLSAGEIEARKRGKTTLVLMEGVRRYVEALPRATFGAQKEL